MKPAVEQIRDQLAKIARRDTTAVLKHMAAYAKMKELGYTTEQVALMLLGVSPEYARKALLKIEQDPPMDIAEPPGPGWWGFEDKKQAGYALEAGKAKPARASSFGDAHERVVTLLKNQAPETRGTVDQIVMIPVAIAAPEGSVRTFQRMSNGKIKEIGAVEETFDGVVKRTVVDADVVEVEK